MKRLLAPAVFCLSILSLGSCSTAGRGGGRLPAEDLVNGEDNQLWLEEIEGAKPLEWVRAHNASSEAELKGDLRFKKIEGEVRKIVLAKDRIPMPGLSNGLIYNFWQDEFAVRGVYRRTTLKEYRKKQPLWDVIIDLDALAKKENENWVWKGASCLPPTHERCLVFLSRGGKDALTVRELDLEKKIFIAPADGGFALPEAKVRVSWQDLNTLLVGTDFGPGSLTKSGYPRIVKRWKRGTPLAEAKSLYEAKESDVAAAGYTQIRAEGSKTFITRTVSFFEEQTFLSQGESELKKIPFPDDADKLGFFHDHFLALLRSDWATGTRTLKSGSLVAMPVATAFEPDAGSRVEVIFEPSDRSSFQSVAGARDFLYVSVLDNVAGKVLRYARGEQGWNFQKLALPGKGVTAVVSSDHFDNHVIASHEGFVSPGALYYSDGRTAALEKVKTIPDRFRATDLVVEQFESTSVDGTRIPYFLVHKKNIKHDGATPALLYGYGGFEIPMTPHYLGALGKSWLERGGAYALANIRGGGEFGPRWHQAALKQNRQKAYDDFISIAEDLISRKITSPRRLGIMGGSNGGLLVGATFVQKPGLFNAVICEVPLLDMLRYHRLLAGNSWMAEYGNPDVPEEAAYLAKYSPYQNVRAGGRYPRVFFVTSTKDDRVHPGHARKMVARMEEQGHPVLYFENIEGGHGAAANLEQKIKKAALEYTYLFRQLMD